MKITFIGLGSMGAPMARLLIDAGYDVTVHNRTAAKAQAFAESGARVADTPREAVTEAEVLITMLADEHAVQDVLDDGLNALPRGALHISMSTVGVDYSRQLGERHVQHGQRYVAAPVFGRPEAAAAKKLWIVAGGHAEDRARARPLLDAIGQGVIEVGDDPISANTVKLAGNHIIAGMMQSLGESFALVRKAGVSAEQFLDIINRLFKSPVYENYGNNIVAEQFSPPGFKLRLGLKDMRLVLAAADASETPMPLASLLHDRMLGALVQGMGDLDWSVVGRLAADEAGLARKGE